MELTFGRTLFPKFHLRVLTGFSRVSPPVYPVLLIDAINLEVRDGQGRQSIRSMSRSASLSTVSE